MIAQSTIQQLRDTASITQVVEAYSIQFDRSGAANCPFHNEKSASFRVKEDKGFFKCFGCGVGGGAIKFVEMMDKCSFPEAVERVAAISNIAVEYDAAQRTDEAKAQRALKKETLPLAAWAATQFQKQLVHHPQAEDYFHSRGWSDDTITQWMLGYTPGGLLQPALHEQGRINDALSIGLINSNKGITRDSFFNRVMFPVQDALGEVVGFGARVLDNAEPKYMNSSDSVIYKKENILYGLCNAAAGIKNQGYALLVEGYADVISMHQAGATHAVATCGTALTDHQCKLLKRHTRRVVIMRDGDAAGLKATMRDLHLLLSHGLQADVAPLSEKEDPDTLARQYFVTPKKAPKTLTATI